MKTTLICLLFGLCCFTSSSQNYVKIRFDKNIDLNEEASFIVGFEYDTKKGKIKQIGKFFEKSGYLRRVNLVVIGGKYYEGSGEVYIHRNTVKKNNNSIIFLYNHPWNKEIEVRDTVKLPELINLKMSDEVGENFFRNITYKMRLEATFSNGKTKIIPKDKIYSFLERNEINLEINGAKMVPKGEIRINSLLNDSLPNFFAIKYSSKNSNFRTSVDSFQITALVDINILPTKFSYDSINKLEAVVTFENGKQEELTGDDLQNILVSYGIKTSSKNGEIINGNFSAFPFSETQPDSAKINLKSNRINKDYNFPMILDKSYSYNFGATNITSFNGTQGENVTILISEISYQKDIFKLSISNTNRTEFIYLNPNYGNLKIESIGSNGSKGRKGKDGRDEFENSRATEGQNGGDGGDGGNGGSINIHLPKSFAKHIHVLKLINSGGKGGSGGSGGSGGIFLDDDGGSGSFWLNLLEAVTTRAPGMKDGIPGNPGREGRNGEINFFYF